ncbi:hypothetical protein [Nocardiopsis sp. L17-MgMaSL7]|uniref:hypothetical protein n=1 Tax=Nocardiopsis sp. L17-MgMaSL7 TaxID=1938893 RepID=UPI000D88D99A|nr:hypothetical protein [Nocardiopsis sp. L17-MgMaSL7]PWV48552.1 hypothetical protein BDW27_110105 [Nocardiopsis sp. L17-MgMaSL7]
MTRHPIGNMDAIQQQEILKEIGGLILGDHPEKGEHLVYEMMKVAGYGSARLTAEYENGESERISPPAAVIGMANRLRAGMYQEGKGTWFSMKYVITRPSSYTVEFNYDDRPTYQFAPEPDLYVEDLKRFPRDPENIPEWLQEELRKAEAEQG